ncbi:MAG: glycosyltransferase [Candidatus Thorarchaeota archaeon]|nr:glycosyltransferase [Candidatus Thorarchaeota archaeon]
MRVLHIVPSFPPNDFVLKDMAYSEKIGGIETIVISTGQGDKKANILATLRNTILTAFRILRIRPHVIHCHFMTSTLPASLVPIPAVVTIHESYNWYSLLWRSILKISTKSCKTIFVSEYNREYWNPVLGREETVIYHAIDNKEYTPGARDAKLREALQTEMNVNYLLFTMGVGEPRRGLHITLKAASILRGRGVNVGVIMRAYGGQAIYRDGLARVAKELDVPTKMLSTRLTDSEMASLFASVDAFIRPTVVESFGIAVLEAQACGTPAVVTNCCSLKEVFGDSSLTFNPGDALDLANQIEVILTDDEAKAKIRKLGLENAKRLSWNRKIKSYLQVYFDAIG